jgi:Ca2+-binding EF-hand superfamily protein
MKKLTQIIRVTLITIGLFSIVPVALSAQNMQQGMGRNMPAFESFDLNHDGYLTESEMNDARAERAQKKVDEGRALRNSAYHSEFSEIDSNGDKKVTKEEFTSHQMKKKR